MYSTRNRIFSGIVKGFMYAVIFINAGLTFFFGGTYGGETFPTSLPGLSFVLGGITLTIFYDFASIAWFLARGRDGQSIDQRGIATTLAVVSMLASTMVSAIHLAMTTNLIDLSPMRGAVGMLGLFMMISMAAAHFIGIFYYQASDPAYAEADAEAALQAEVASFMIQQKVDVNGKVMKKTQQLMNRQIEAIAEQQAAQLWESIYATLNTLPPGETAPNTPTMPAAPQRDEEDYPLEELPEVVTFANGNGRNHDPLDDGEDFLVNGGFE